MNQIVNLAKLIRTRFDLAFPVPIESLARQVAECSEELLPTPSDALVLLPGPNRQRPLIVMDPNCPPTRKRFTLAHEVGHILIPWHDGVYSCNVESFDGSIHYKEMEFEASLFASELLMPTEVIQSQPGWAENPAHTTSNLAAQAGVSMIAAAYRLIRMLPPGHFFIETNGKNQVLCSGMAKGTRLKLPRKPSILDIEGFARRFGPPLSERSSYSHLYWWKIDGDAGDFVPDAIDSKMLLEIILQGIQNIDVKKISNSINALTNVGFNRNKDLSEAVIKSDTIRRMIRKEIPAVIRDHPRFDAYLNKRIAELRARKYQSSDDS